MDWTTFVKRMPLQGQALIHGNFEVTQEEIFTAAFLLSG